MVSSKDKPSSLGLICKMCIRDRFIPECSIEQDMSLGLPVLMQLEDSALLYALKELSERERYIFFARALDGKSFEVLAEEMEMGYKGVSAVYYRTVQKIKRKIEVMKNEF